MMPAETGAYVAGIAFWSPRLPGWEIAAPVLAGRMPAPGAAVRRPTPALLPPTERRRAPDSVAVALEVAARACAAAELDAGQLASVFATAHGDLGITDYLCRTLVESPLQTSPTRFHNSVHNAAAGYWSIAGACHAPYTTVSVAEYSFGAGLLEALTQVATGREPVLLVAYDAPACGPLAQLVSCRGIIGAALVLAPARSAPGAAHIRWSIAGPEAAAASEAAPALAAVADDNPMAAALPLYAALAAGGGAVALPLSPTLALRLEVR